MDRVTIFIGSSSEGLLRQERLRHHVHLLALMVLSLILPGITRPVCAGAGDATAAPTVSTHSTSSSDTAVTSDIREFYRIIRLELAAGEECTAALEYLRGLPSAEQLAVARAVANDPNARIGYVGAGLLIQHGRIDEAVPSLADIIASDRATTQLNGRMAYDWVHGDDATLALRMQVRIARHLLAHLDSYTDPLPAERFLMGGLFMKATKPFSRAEAEHNISDWEAALSDLDHAQRPAE